MKKSLYALLGLSLFTTQAFADILIEDVTYQYENFQFATGTYSYDDWTMEQLTDGIIGTNEWTDDLGNGNAYEWVSSRTIANPQISFSFTDPTYVQYVRIGLFSGGSSILSPQSITLYSDMARTVEIGEISIPTRFRDGFIYGRQWVDGYINTSVDTVYMDFSMLNPNNFLFIDEVEFYSDVPAPLVGLSALGLFAFARRRKINKTSEC